MNLLTVILMTWVSCRDFAAAISNRQETEPGCDNVGQSNLNSFLWMLKRDPPSYFFGTIHVPYNRVWDYIPENTKVAFKQSDNIFFELDLTNPYTVSALANCQMLPKGENLSNILPKDIYNRLKDHLEYVREKLPHWITDAQRGKGLYAENLFDIIAGNWERKRPVWVMLLVNSLTESDIKSREIPVLDLYLAREAERLRKITGAVEKVEEQCVPLNDLNFSQVLFALNHTLWQHESYRLTESAIPYTTDDLIHHYNCGDLNDIIFNRDSTKVPNLLNYSLPPDHLKTAEVIDNYFRTELINKRNERMAFRAARLLNDHPNESFFFAFGAGHFMGNNTVVDRLRELGFDFVHMQPEEEIPKVDYDNDWSEHTSPYLSTKSTSYPLSASVFSGDVEFFVNNRIVADTLIYGTPLANIVDPDETAPTGAVSSGSTLFANTSNHITMRLRLHRRHKNRRKNKLEQEFGDLWDQMDEESKSWLEQTRREKRKNYNSNKPFNDLWVRMETPSPGRMQELAERKTTPKLTRHHFSTGQSAFCHCGWTGTSLAMFILLSQSILQLLLV